MTFHLVDAATFITTARPGRFDLIYADAWPGRFSHLADALGWVAVQAKSDRNLGVERREPKRHLDGHRSHCPA